TAPERAGREKKPATLRCVAVCRGPWRGGFNQAMAMGIMAKVAAHVVSIPTPPSQPNCENPRKVAAARPTYAAEAVAAAARVPGAACQPARAIARSRGTSN